MMDEGTGLGNIGKHKLILIVATVAIFNLSSAGPMDLRGKNRVSIVPVYVYHIYIYIASQFVRNSPETM